MQALADAAQAPLGFRPGVTTFFPTHPGACIINPRNSAMKQWDLVMMACLLFTAVFTPFEVAFLQTSLDPLFVINR